MIDLWKEEANLLNAAATPAGTRWTPVFRLHGFRSLYEYQGRRWMDELVEETANYGTEMTNPLWIAKTGIVWSGTPVSVGAVVRARLARATALQRKSVEFERQQHLSYSPAADTPLNDEHVPAGEA